MKKLLILLAITINLNANATHRITYFVYFETEYVQGPWLRTDLLEKSNYHYLSSHAFEGLFGSEKIELVNAMLGRLKENKPNLYTWKYDLEIKDDTVVLLTREKVTLSETIKNEVTATLALNGFKTVVFKYAEDEDVLTIKDLTLPYFDLIVPGKRQKAITSSKLQKVDNKSEIKDKKKENTNNTEPPNSDSNPLIVWLLISGVLNFGLLSLLLMKKAKPN